MPQGSGRAGPRQIESLIGTGTGTGTCDWILDFQADDRLDLSRLDANLAKSGNQAFSWIGIAAFPSPGQLRYTVVNGIGLVEGKTIGSTGAEFQLLLPGAFALRGGTHVLSHASPAGSLARFAEVSAGKEQICDQGPSQPPPPRSGAAPGFSL
jgi:hypothetical protein